MRLVLSSIVLVALVANPCFAKGGHSHGHAQHGAGADAGASGNGATAKGARGAIPAPSRANAPIDSEAPVAPPVLPPRGVTQQQIRINPRVKATNPEISSRRQLDVPPITAPTARNAIGQPVVSPAPKNFPGAQPLLPPQRSGAVSPPTIHGGPAAPPASSGPARVNLANNRGVNGATVIRPANAPSGIGGPAQARYGINGTMVQNKH